jgi:hypothetical protein
MRIYLRQKSLPGEDVDPGHLGQIDSEDSLEMSQQVEARLVSFRLGPVSEGDVGPGVDLVSTQLLQRLLHGLHATRRNQHV